MRKKQKKSGLRRSRKTKSNIQVADAGYSPLFHTDSSAWNRGLCYAVPAGANETFKEQEAFHLPRQAQHNTAPENTQVLLLRFS